MAILPISGSTKMDFHSPRFAPGDRVIMLREAAGEHGTVLRQVSNNDPRLAYQLYFVVQLDRGQELIEVLPSHLKHEDLPKALREAERKERERLNQMWPKRTRLIDEIVAAMDTLSISTPGVRENLTQLSLAKLEELLRRLKASAK